MFARITTALAIVAIAIVGFGATAQADVFSNQISPNPQLAYVEDCTVAMGIVFDPVRAFPNYRKIGGVQVNCTYVHRTLTAVVWLQWYNFQTASWTFYGSPGTMISNNTRGWGTAIIETPGYCVGIGARGNYWRVYTTVNTGTRVQSWYTQYQQDNYGC